MRQFDRWHQEVVAFPILLKSMTNLIAITVPLLTHRSQLSSSGSAGEGRRSLGSSARTIRNAGGPLGALGLLKGGGLEELSSAVFACLVYVTVFHCSPNFIAETLGHQEVISAVGQEPNRVRPSC